MLRQQYVAATLGLSLLFGAALGRAADKSPARGEERRGADAPEPTDPEAFLKSKGLKRSDPFVVLADESDFIKKVAGLDKLKKDVVETQKKENLAARDLAAKKQQIIDLLKMRAAISDQLAQTNTANRHNQLVAQHNQLADRLNLLNEEVADHAEPTEIEKEANKAREAYAGRVLESREQYGRLLVKYAALAAEERVGQMIDAYNAAHERKLKLGPAVGLLSSERKLQKFEETVLSDAIDIRRGPSGLWEISVVINGKEPQIIFLDTGASIVSLPYQTAKAVGLTPSGNAPVQKFQVADGRTVEAKMVVADSIRVGKFVVEKVDVSVAPADLRDAPALLGQSFLKHFTYKIDTANSKLVMTKVDAAPTGAGSTTTKPKTTSN
jgi:clan AA aspartic protease (TIGR02281 family)